jgi:hypothetical protein
MSASLFPLPLLLNQRGALDRLLQEDKIMDAAWELAVAPRPHRVLKLRLLPMTLGHGFLLEEHDAAYLEGGIPAWDDLLTSVLICSQPHAKARRSLGKWSTRQFAKIWKLFNLRIDPVSEVLAFLKYLEESFAAPEISPPRQGKSRELNAPMLWRLLVMLMVDFHMSKEEALNMTVVEAQCLWATEGDRQGTLELVAGRLDKLREFAAAQDAKKRAASEGAA